MSDLNTFGFGIKITMANQSLDRLRQKREELHEAEREWEERQLDVYHAFTKMHPEFRKGSLWTPDKSLSLSPNRITNEVPCPLRFNEHGQVTEICVVPDRLKDLVFAERTVWVPLNNKDGSPRLKHVKE